MSDLISRSALMEALEKEQKECEIDMTSPNFFKAKMIAREQPTIEAVPVVERNKIIDEFAEMCKADIMCQTFGLHPINIDKIAEQMKGGTK